ncbi:carbohydrate-binding protein [Dyadobacter sediminis]|uniref:Carbohydrate-binding protein n=2 Tax=Dyadobacter sediminis TaxID=1493691 RepID=A0A5R9K929_9BACT|nr:carbohydrate-binding protein [Dyadobacter sediminis]
MLLANKLHTIKFSHLLEMKKILLFIFLFCAHLSQAQTYKSLPGKIEAENYDLMYGVQTETTSDTLGGLNVGFIDDGDWMDYNIKTVSAGLHTFHFRVANNYGYGIIEIKDAGNNVLGQVSVPQTGGWQSWITITTQVNLPAGDQVIRLFAKSGAFNLNWFEPVLLVVPDLETTLPARIEAEDFNAMNNALTEPTSDAGGGSNVRWMEDGSWMDYKVQVPAHGFYTISYRIANGFSPDATISLKAENGTVLGQTKLPQTGGMQGWKTVNMIAELPAGNHTLRLFTEKGIFSLNWFEVKNPRPLPGKLEAESFDVTNNARLEPTTDMDAGYAVSYINDGDWMDYNVNMAASGIHTLNFRISNSYGNGLIEIRNAAGTILGQVDVPQTGGWQNWSTIRTTVNFSAGSQILRIHAKRGAFNLNWLEVVSGSVQGQSVITMAPITDKNIGDIGFNMTATSNNNETPVILTSSNPEVAAVSNSGDSWRVTLVGAGDVTITASQAGNNNYMPALDVSRSFTVAGSSRPSDPAYGTKIPIDPKRWYQLTNAANGLEGLFDGNTQENVHTGWGKIIDYYEAYYPLLEGEQISLDHIRFFDYTGSTPDQPMILSVIDDQWRRIPIATFTGEIYNGWVGPYPNRPLTGNDPFKLDSVITNIRYLVITVPHTLPTEIEFYGNYTAPAQTQKQFRTRNIRLNDMIGVNGYEWNFQDGAHAEKLVESKMNAVKGFSGFRHYMDWEKLESSEGVFSYNPTLSGSWNYDLIYERCKQENIEVLACLKTLSNWMLSSYPDSLKDHENVPVRYGKDFKDPLSYIEQARVGFQYAARYGSNKNVDPTLLSVSTTPRWFGDYPNTVRIGLDLVKYIECDNERDKWWKGRKGYQTAREYAANLSAFYDGHKNTMGPAVGIKNADPNMKVVIAGLVTGPDFVKGMVDWCKEFRGYNADGSVNLCWDIINFHIYTDNTSSSQSGTSTRGAAPEVTNASQILQDFVKVSQEVSNDLPVWITESGYDISQTSPLKAIPIGNKSAMQTQADWILRTSLFSARNGIEKLFFYQLYDDNGSGGMFGTSGLLNNDQTRRPSADYLFQTKKLFGEYVYKETINADPIVDRYELNGKSLFILAVPDEVGRTGEYTLNLNGATAARIYTPTAGSDNMAMTEVPVNGGSLTVTAGETPIFIVGVSDPNARKAAAETLTPALAPVEKVLHEDVTVYPNPASGFVNIDLANENTGILEINIFDSKTGRLHTKTQVHKSGSKLSHKLDLTSMPVGVYVVEVKQGNESAFRKIAKVD